MAKQPIEKAVWAAGGPFACAAASGKLDNSPMNCLRFPSLVLGKMPRPCYEIHFSTDC
jgi:hypothetical protein